MDGETDATASELDPDLCREVAQAVTGRGLTLYPNLQFNSED